MCGKFAKNRNIRIVDAEPEMSAQNVVSIFRESYDLSINPETVRQSITRHTTVGKSHI